MTRPSNVLLFLIIAILFRIDLAMASDRFLLGYEKHQPSWYSKLDKKLIKGDLNDNWLSEITSIVSSDKKGGVADLVLYYENMREALTLFTKNNIHAASAYKAKALTHLEAATATNLPEAQIEKALLILDGLFPEYDYKDAINILISALPHHPKASDLISTFDLQAYQTIEEREKIEKKSHGALFWTNAVLKYYGSITTGMRSPYSDWLKLRTNQFLLPNPPDYLEPFERKHGVGMRCAMLLLLESEGRKVDAYRKIQRCTNSGYSKTKYFLPELRNGIRSGQTHYLNYVGIALIFDKDPGNDQEGVEYLKLAISYGYPGEYRLMQYYNFVSGDIDKCEKIYKNLPWKITNHKSNSKLYIDADGHTDFFGKRNEGLRHIEIELPWGCFENTARVNGDKIPVTVDWRFHQYAIGITTPKEDFKNKQKCFEFVNARISYHPNFYLNGSINGSKQIAFCED